jgi:hypothetical protein
MNESRQTRVVVGLLVLAVLCTVAIGLWERRSASLAAYSPASPLRVGRSRQELLPQRTLRWQRALQRLGTRAFWLKPLPWIIVGVVGFGLLAWGIVRGIERMERD